MKKLFTIVIFNLMLYNNVSFASGFTNINCKFDNGHSIIDGSKINVPRGFKGTHDILIVLEPDAQKIITWDGISGIIFASNINWSETKIYWRWVMEKDTNIFTYTDYYLNRMSGQLMVYFESKIKKYGSSSYTYYCKKVEQKF